MIFLSNPNGIVGTFGGLPALSLTCGNDIPTGDWKTPMPTAARMSGLSLKTLRDGNTDLIPRSLQSKRLEGWPQRMDSRPSFEMRAKYARSSG